MDFVGKKVNLYFDSQRQGFDSAMWSTLSGTPYINANNNLEVNASAIVGTADISRGNVKMFLTIPNDPASGHTREWGLYQVNSSAKATFKITDAVFSAYVSDIYGNTDSATLTWETGWTDVSTKFEIEYLPGHVVFSINGRKFAEFYGSGCPSGTLSVYLSNAYGDSVELSHVQIVDADIYSAGPQTTIATVEGTTSSSSSSSAWTQYQNDSFATAVIKSTPGRVYSFMLINTTASTRYFQLHNAASAPASGDTPEIKILVPAGSSVGVGTDILGLTGKVFSTGIVAANSTTSTTYTAGSAGDLLLDLFYDGATSTSYLLMESGFDLLLETSDLLLQE